MENFNLICEVKDKIESWYVDPSHHGKENLNLYVQVLFFYWCLPGVLFPHTIPGGCFLNVIAINPWKPLKILFFPLSF